MNRRCWTRLTGLLVCLATLLSSACANIPEESSPQAARNGNGKPSGVVPQPDPNASPYDLVREFIRRAGYPEAAKTYLTEDARQRWPGGSPPTIIEETFGTAPLPVQERRGLGDEQSTEVIVVLTVNKLGRLDADRAFVPAVGGAEYRVVVRRGPDGQWRIATPPDTVLITMADFRTDFQAVSIYFFDPDLRVLVPDRRYVAAQPVGNGPAEAIQLLLHGPSETLGDAVRTLLNEDTTTRTNVVLDADGELEVNLTQLGEKTPGERRLIAAQVVLSLRDVTNSGIRLLVDGRPLVADHDGAWRPSDMPSYDSPTKPDAGLTGLFVADGRLYTLRDGRPVDGPAGTGEYQVLGAAQSIDGRSLALVQATATGARLRIGAVNEALRPVELEAAKLTRPTWRVSTSTETESNEVWTVQNGVDVTRVIRTADGTWDPSPVNASALAPFGTITELRLSRDGARLAAVANGQVVVASVARAKDSVTIRGARALQDKQLTNVVGVDWLNQDTVVVATSNDGGPVVSVTVDGFAVSRYNSANLVSPVTAVTAAPARDVVVTDINGMWSSSEIGAVWRPLLPDIRVPSNAVPFYPG